ncbi:ubiquinol-cytochrome c reductase iron-sulfur subunit [Streptomyces sp. NPDC001544]|uniref:QcrA and Rieske domain-containing protein n=1 Tax=Streptomyces sp. NPDC001544 TaxID=3364584 RepID=UPI00369B15FF
MTHGATRRTVLTTGAGALAAGCVGCGGNNSGGNSSSANSSSPHSSSGSGGRELGSTSDIPEGGGKVFADQKVVVTQPKKGEFKAFSAICTHEGCTVNQVVDGKIDCPCHGSQFEIADGSVARGPAAKPLPAENITVHGNSIRLV